MIDAHAHLDKYGEALPRALGQIREHSIFTVSVSMDVGSYEVTRGIAEGEPLVLPAFGIHPWEASRYNNELSTLDPFLESAGIIGEIGLDHFFVKDSGRYAAQEVVFSYCLEAAERQGKLVNIHTVGAETAVLENLQSRSLPGVIVHWYSGPLELLDDYLALGAYFTVGVEILRSSHIQRIARAIPAERILTETDNPGGWQWMEGELGFPELLSRIESALATTRGMVREDLSRQVSDNMSRLLSLGGLSLPNRTRGGA